MKNETWMIFICTIPERDDDFKRFANTISRQKLFYDVTSFG